MNQPTVTIDGMVYVINELSEDAQRLLHYLREAQSELERLETRKTLTLLSQQQLLAQLSPLLPTKTTQNTNLKPINSVNGGNGIFLGRATGQIPVTDAEKPKEMPAPFPENLPDTIRTE